MNIHSIEGNDVAAIFINCHAGGKVRYLAGVMKHADIEKIHEAGLISDEQRDQIIARFGLQEESSRFLIIITFIGAVLLSAGVILLISAHWDEIPRGVKLVTSLGLMLGAHAAGWWLREVHGQYKKTGEAMHFVGSALFLANIALIGQIYHLDSRFPDAFLAWWLGIAALPWLLRSPAQFLLFLIALSIWFGSEINQRDSRIYFGSEPQVLAYALLGLIYIGAGYWLRRTSFADFAPLAEKTGTFGLLVFAYPLTWAGFDFGRPAGDGLCVWLLPVLAMVAILATTTGVRQLCGLARQWQATWALALAGAAGLVCAEYFVPSHPINFWQAGFDTVNAVAVLALFVFCLLQIQIGLQLRSRFMVNLGVAFIGLDIVSAYFGLFGTMARTGLMFVVSGIFLIVFGVYLEKKRRKFIRQMRLPAVKEVP